MKRVLICNQKGGAGKSLIADESAFAMERRHTPCSFWDPDIRTMHETGWKRQISYSSHSGRSAGIYRR